MAYGPLTIPKNTVRTQAFPLGGGLDLRTPPINVRPGRALASTNYEPLRRGYGRFRGYERFDGQPKPSDATYYIINFDGGTAEIAEDDTVTGANSGASAVAVIDAVVESGSYGGADAAGYIVVYGAGGADFVDDDPLQVSAVTKSTADGSPTLEGADNDTDHNTWLQSAIEKTRALIQKVPGAGSVLGVWAVDDGTIYAFRNHTDSLTTKMWENTVSGWSEVDLGNIIAFDTGTTEFTVGGTLTGGTSSATATIRGVRVVSGDWSTNDAAGYICIGDVTSGPYDAGGEVIADGSGGSAMSTGSEVDTTIAPSGKFEFVNYNFGGHANTRRMYGVNGVDNAFEWDGTAFFPIVTGMTVDTPAHIAGHLNHLFLSFSGGSLQHSAIGNPHSWAPILGAAELAIGENIVGLVGELNDTLVVYGRNKIRILYGSSVLDWDLVGFSDEVGAHEWSIQNMGDPVSYDDRGIRQLSTTADYGDFARGTLSLDFEEYLEGKRANNLGVATSMRVKRKDQYRLFFEDKNVAVVNFSGENPAMLNLVLPIQANVAFSLEDTTGQEQLFVGAEDGYVYEFDKGTSNDGAAIEAFIRLAFNHLRSNDYEKVYHRFCVELDSTTGTVLYLYPDFSYGDPDIPTAQQVEVTPAGGRWDIDSWNTFVWDGTAEQRACVYFDGIGTNLSVIIASELTYVEPYVLHGATTQFEITGLNR